MIFRELTQTLNTMILTRNFLGALLSSSALGQVHHLYSGVFTGSSLYGVEFNEESSKLRVIYNGTLDISSSKWIAADVSLVLEQHISFSLHHEYTNTSQQKTNSNIYIANENAYESYAINRDYSLAYSGNVSISEKCSK